MYVSSNVPPPDKLPGVADVGKVLMVHCAVCTVAVKLPLLCAQAADDPNKAKATMARAGSVIFVNIFLSCWFSVPPGEERVFTAGSPETTASYPIKESALRCIRGGALGR